MESTLKKNYNKIFICAAIQLLMLSCTDKLSYEKELIGNSSNIVLVVSENWNDSLAQVYLLSRSDMGYKKASESMNGIIGKKGLGIGIGEHTDASFQQFKNVDENIPIKKEGDKKSPAGIFKIGKIMGFADSLPFSSDLEYKKITQGLHAVDDSDSEYYNQIVNANLLKPLFHDYYNSYEDMFHLQHAYDWLFEIKHNSERIPEKGSNIFFHIRNVNGSGTAGCTAVNRDDLLQILKFIDKQTLVIQLPEEIYQKVHKELNLPLINEL